MSATSPPRPRATWSAPAPPSQWPKPPLTPLTCRCNSAVANATLVALLAPPQNVTAGSPPWSRSGSWGSNAYPPLPSVSLTRPMPASSHASRPNGTTPAAPSQTSDLSSRRSRKPSGPTSYRHPWPYQSHRRRLTPPPLPWGQARRPRHSQPSRGFRRTLLLLQGSHRDPCPLPPHQPTPWP